MRSNWSPRKRERGGESKSYYWKQASVPSPIPHTHKQPGRQATNRWSRSEKTPSSFLPPVESKQQNRADVDKKWKCSFSVSERDRKWEWKVLAKITPSHKHTHTHTERENKNHPRLTTFNLPVDWCNLEFRSASSWPAALRSGSCKIVKFFFSSFFRLCYSLLFCSYAYCHHHHRQETGRKLFRFGCLCCHEICSVEKKTAGLVLEYHVCQVKCYYRNLLLNTTEMQLEKNKNA